MVDRAPRGRRAMCHYCKKPADWRKTSVGESPRGTTTLGGKATWLMGSRICSRYVRNVGATGSNPVTSTRLRSSPFGLDLVSGDGFLLLPGGLCRLGWEGNECLTGAGAEAVQIPSPPPDFGRILSASTSLPGAGCGFLPLRRASSEAWGCTSSLGVISNARIEDRRHRRHPGARSHKPCRRRALLRPCRRLPRLRGSGRRGGSNPREARTTRCDSCRPWEMRYRRSLRL